MATETYDIVVVGAGISGIDAGYRIQEQLPGLKYTILEARDAIGGTWDLFRFPGIRSDSDLHTFGFPFRPWKLHNAIAEAPLILEYMRETAAEFGIDKKMQFRHRVESAEWSSKRQKWTLSVTANEDQQKTIRTSFVFWCTGYYDYKNPLSANIPGISNFRGLTIHPQFWPEDLDYKDKKVVIIGSGATAVTILPNIAKQTPHVTMLQRSPTYIVAMPQDDTINRTLRTILPSSIAYRLIRFRFVMLAYLSFTIFQAFPNFARKLLSKQAQSLLPKDYKMDPNFNPRYNPWDQRLCVSPSGDFYAAIRNGRAQVVTGEIEQVTDQTIRLKDGTELSADIIVTATGLRLQIAGGAKVSVDGTPIDISERFVYRHAMLNDVPNACLFVGYTNASWTLGSDSTAHYMCRLVNFMRGKGYASATPRVGDKGMQRKALLDLNSTYIKAGGNVLPSAGSGKRWQPRSMYLWDLWEAKRSDFGELEFRSEREVMEVEEERGQRDSVLSEKVAA
ncbi:monooxygenase flavin-binding family protein-like protein [Elsinoe ampelina]|uniref:Monooxygenase flavin-binding family protein-like protein n=1 Tax=Elsinoe ampelina TaxID=302913 RepID=A0A6A6G8X7_9PEZI|nr:monooxygenase flavin-binding family protein-like protein [Elsinoe ampelina]